MFYPKVVHVELAPWLQDVGGAFFVGDLKEFWGHLRKLEEVTDGDAGSSPERATSLVRKSYSFYDAIHGGEQVCCSHRYSRPPP